MVKFPDKLEVLARVRYHSKGYINLLERNEAFGQLERANRFIRKTFGRYLSDDIVDTILESPDGASLGGEKRKLTIMMTDLRGFTAISERLAAETVVSIINIFLEIMTEIILKYQGTIDEFIGDAILAIFGAPILQQNDAQRAVACALEMQLAMEDVNVRYREAGYPEVSMGIGINTGDVVVGNIGSSKRTKYGVVGRHVNLTSRIESYTVGGQILISESTLHECNDLLRIDDDMEVMPKGVREPITIYEVGGIGGEFHIFRPEKHPVELAPLSQPVTIQFTFLEGKHAGKELNTATIVKMHDRLAEVQATVSAGKLANLKIFLFDGQQQEITSELYAKVVQVISEDPSIFLINFTSVPAEADAFFQQIGGSE
jgi:adenylate cyclase